MVCCILAAYLFGRICLAVRWAYRKLRGRPQTASATMPTPTRSLSADPGSPAVPGVEHMGPIVSEVMRNNAKLRSRLGPDEPITLVSLLRKLLAE
jgi:hypothetical protein